MVSCSYTRTTLELPEHGLVHEGTWAYGSRGMEHRHGWISPHGEASATGEESVAGSWPETSGTCNKATQLHW